MRVNIWLVITILAIEVSFSMATRSVEAALEKQLNKKGYAVLQLKKRRLVLRDINENEVSKHDSNQSNEANKKSKAQSQSQDSIPADTALRKKYIDTNVMKRLANTNLSIYHRHKRNKDKHEDFLQKAAKDDLDTVKKSLMAEANAIAAAIESEEVREEIDSENGNIADENEMQQSQSKVESDDEDNANASNEDYDDKEEKVVSDQWEPGSEDKDAENHSGGGESLESSEDDEKTQTSAKETKSYDASELAKEVGSVFNLLAKGEKHLLEKMEEIKSSLGKSIISLQDVEREMIVKRKRRDAYANKALAEVMSSLTKDDFSKLLARSKRENFEGPSRACIFIDAPILSNVPASEHDVHQAQSQTYSNELSWNSNNFAQEQDHSGQSQNQAPSNSEGGNFGDTSAENNNQQQEYSKSIDQESKSESVHNHLSIDDTNHEHFQSSISNVVNSSSEKNNNHVSEEGSQSMDESIDLHSIYWLKLPNEYNDSFDQKVYSLLSGISHTGRDILIIPVTRSYTSSEEITDGFLRAVQVTPNSQRAQYFKIVRELNILRIK